MKGATVTMLEDKGADYVARWPHGIADRAGISVEYVADALATITGARINRMAFYADTAVSEIGALTPAQAKAVAAEMVGIHRQITSTQDITHCRGCGLPLDGNGECEECQ